MGYPKVYRNEGGTGTITFMAPGLASRAVYINPFRVGDLWWEEREMSAGWVLLFGHEEAKVTELDTAIPITPPDECFAVRNTGYGACEATIHRDKNTMNVSIPCGDEALTKRERFAMEAMTAIIAKKLYSAGLQNASEDEARRDNLRKQSTASGAVSYADALIAELAKERK